MILAFDSYYFDNKAKTVCVSFENWTDSEPIHIYTEILEGIADYEPGSFYKRELPCILSLLKQIDLSKVYVIIVDSFVLLNDEEKLGLGGHLHKALESRIPIVGVAKTGFHNNKKNVKELFRGESKKPLFISAMGITLNDAHQKIKSMHGDFRMPTLLQLMDKTTKEV